jgi:hypothetical protein
MYELFLNKKEKNDFFFSFSAIFIFIKSIGYYCSDF